MVMMSCMQNIYFTYHALDRIKSRGLELNTIIDSINTPDIIETDYRLLYFIKKIDHRYLRIVVKVVSKAYLVLTAYFDRKLRRKLDENRVK
jgi:hypothetical protein